MHTENQNTNSITMDRSPNAVALDNLVRRKLRVSDPNDAGQVAEALRKIYEDESHALDQEAAGVPFLQPLRSPSIVENDTASRAELTEALDDVNRDLTSLTNNALLKDVHPELNGWATAIRSISAEGTNAARYSLDPRQRDKAFAARRQLGGYARLARYVGALTPTQSLPYRKLAQSLDEVANVILVMMGDALANIGYSGGRFLLQVPASELQGRRDAVIYALRNLTGSVQEGYGPNDWPRGLLAYRQFLNRLEAAGQTDLRSLLVENHIAKVMDDLVHWTTSGSADDLRALGSTAHLALEQFKRLIRIGQRLVDPESPPLSSFFSAIQLFVDGFVNGAIGHRLLYISRPAILSYGLYGFGEQDDATKRLLAITQARGNLANKLDCYLGCDCTTDRVECQIKLDKILYDVDRAIDLYALGSDPQGKGEPETRAAAFGFLINQFLSMAENNANDPCRFDCLYKDRNSCGPIDGSDPVEFKRGPIEYVPGLEASLKNIQNLLWWANPPTTFTGTFNLQGFEIDPNGTGSTVPIQGFATVVHFSELKGEVETVLGAISNETTLEPTDVITDPAEVQQQLKDYVSLLNQMHQELCIQKDIESEWGNLLQTMAPSCHRFDGGEIIATKQLLQNAINAVSLGQLCPGFDVNIPPHLETSLSGITYLTNSEGGN
jgi:hypothetical protein